MLNIKNEIQNIIQELSSKEKILKKNFNINDYKIKNMCERTYTSLICKEFKEYDVISEIPINIKKSEILKNKIKFIKNDKNYFIDNLILIEPKKIIFMESKLNMNDSKLMLEDILKLLINMFLTNQEESKFINFSTNNKIDTVREYSITFDFNNFNSLSREDIFNNIKNKIKSINCDIKYTFYINIKIEISNFNNGNEQLIDNMIELNYIIEYIKEWVWNKNKKYLKLVDNNLQLKKINIDFNNIKSIFGQNVLLSIIKKVNNDDKIKEKLIKFINNVIDNNIDENKKILPSNDISAKIIKKLYYIFENNNNSEVFNIIMNIKNNEILELDIINYFKNIFNEYYHENNNINKKTNYENIHTKRSQLIFDMLLYIFDDNKLNNIEDFKKEFFTILKSQNDNIEYFIILSLLIIYIGIASINNSNISIDNKANNILSNLIKHDSKLETINQKIINKYEKNEQNNDYIKWIDLNNVNSN